MTVVADVVTPAHRRTPRFLPRSLGPATIWALVAGLLVLWLVLRPAGESSGEFVGQLLGAEAVLLMSIGMVLISMLPWVEPWFDGIDRAAIWHRRTMIAGLVLLVPHAMVTSGADGSSLGGTLGAIGLIGLAALAAWSVLPRWRSIAPTRLLGVAARLRETTWGATLKWWIGGYELWRALHRTTGLFLAAGFVHGLMDGSAFHSQPLRWTYIVIGAVGLGFYGYRELLARHLMALHDYEVAAVTPLGSGLVEIALRPLGRPFDFVPGQFAMLYLEARDGWHRHPFTIASGAHEPVVRVTVKGLGDFTSSIADLLEPGMPAVIAGPHGRFDHRRGGDHQVWIAGGVGITPFLSWLRSADVVSLPPRVDFFYSAAGPLPFADEVDAVAARHPELHPYLVDTRLEGRLTVEEILAAADADPAELSAFLCGPEPMLTTFTAALRTAGIRPSRIHREYLDLR